MTITWVLFALGLIVSLMTLFAAVGVLKPNGLIGIRTASTKKSPEAWQKGHAKAARVTVPLGLLASAWGLALALGWPEFTRNLGEPAVLVGIGILVVGTLTGGWLAERAAQDTVSGASSAAAPARGH